MTEQQAEHAVGGKMKQKLPCYWCGSYLHYHCKMEAHDDACRAEIALALIDAVIGGRERKRWAQRAINHALKRAPKLVSEARKLNGR